MNPFINLSQRIQHWLEQKPSEMFVRGVSSSSWSFIYSQTIEKNFASRNVVIITPTTEEAERIWDETKHNENTHFFPGLGHSPYTSILSSESALMQRFNVLSLLSKSENPLTIITSLDASLLYCPPRKFFEINGLKLATDDIVAPQLLSEKLVELGYRSTPSIEEPGTFTRKGEVFDIFPISNNPIRLHYFDDLIESIHEMDPETQKTIQSIKIEKILISPAPGLLAKDEFSTTLRANLPQPQPQFKNRYDTRKSIFQQLSQGLLFENYPVYAPLFFEKPETLIDYLPSNSIIIEIDRNNATQEWDSFLSVWRDEFELESQRIDSSITLPGPEKLTKIDLSTQKFHHLVVESLDITVDLDNKIKNDIHLSVNTLRTQILPKIQARIGTVPDNKFAYIKALMAVLRDEVKKGANLLISTRTEISRQEFEYLLRENDIPLNENKISWTTAVLTEGFYYKAENLWVISEADLFSSKQRKAKKTQATNPDLFADQLATLKAGDFVVHRDFGIGIYRGLETLKVGDQESDFLVLEYEKKDKVYVPVYRLNLVQKHADANSHAKVASLQSKKFSEQKAKARQSVKKLAFDLLRMQAERKLEGGFPFSEPDHLFKEFELSFPFEETPDQMKAIADVLEDMQAQYPMDRLVCGDVGFGKTEVAMRGAFKAVLDKKQVVVLVPTTVLALQHYHSFKRRFNAFPVNIEMLSRFKTAKESAQVIANLKEGTVDILIGTHAVLSEKVEFFDLGLVVIDEEHRFGVNHKEKLKLLRKGVDVLTMTATPIPRTMQMAFLGVRDMSIIQTAPPRRQAIKSYIIKEDDVTLRSAIEKELSRGGQIFYVHNRVHDIEEHEIYLKKLVPKAKITVTHGQMPEKELEKRINDFIEHKSDILLSTTIIESGIDIPNANTMIIDRADTYGLAQLHQLRGRIGRSDRKAYAYFMVPENRILSEIATRRLQALQTYAEMGSGFSLASADLEIRGAGDILGAEQHGHVDQIGLELYMDLLQEAVLEIKGEKTLSARNIEIQAPFNAFIPNNYITDHSARLKYYKRLSNSQSHEKIDELSSEIADSFGLIPRELETLLIILRTRLWFRPAGIRLAKVSLSTITLFFDQEVLSNDEDLRDKIFSVFIGKPKLYKINPDSSVQCFFKDTVSQHTLLEFAKHVAGQIGA
ncbi:MAG: transcription-repair coupling factor [Bacteriovoracaceae bacterium]|nr:transcription-repair coupling factor [Bacteriovoracaceae bacterium]